MGKKLIKSNLKYEELIQQYGEEMNDYKPLTDIIKAEIQRRHEQILHGEPLATIIKEYLDGEKDKDKKNKKEGYSTEEKKGPA